MRRPVSEEGAPESDVFPGALSPRGMIPADAVRMSQTDPWVRRLFIGAIATSVVTILLAIMFKLILVYGASAIAVASH